MLKNFANLNKENFSINSILLVNLALGLFPISFILGNFIINLNIILFCILGIIILKSKILTSEYNFPIKIIFLLFLVILFSTALSFILSSYNEGYEVIHFERLIKSILFFRYFLMLIILYLLNKNNFLNYKYLYISAAFSTIIVSMDIIYQFIFGFNIIGLASYGHHNSSFFGDELIAGGFIQRFSFFSIFFIALFFSSKKKHKFIFTVISICIFGVGIILSGNRMPLILFLLGLILIFLINNNLRKIIPVGMVCLLIIFKFLTYNDPYVRDSYISLYSNIGDTFSNVSQVIIPKNSSKDVEKKSEIAKEKQDKNDLINDYILHNRLFLAAFDIWEKNKILGDGIKSFRVNCHKLQSHAIEPLDEYNLTEEYVETKKNRLCSNHPHNYFVEIIVETGVVGFIITLIIAILFIAFIFKKFKILKGSSEENFLLLAAVISLFIELFPIRTTGSVFSTNNITYIILIASIILSNQKGILARN